METLYCLKKFMRRCLNDYVVPTPVMISRENRYRSGQRMVPPRFEVAEILNLQALRDDARRRRAD